MTYNPATSTATWVDRSYDLGDLPITDVARDDVTGDLYASSDFGVVRLLSGATDLDRRSTGDAERGSRRLDHRAGRAPLYAASHGFGAWLLNLP